MPLTAYLPLEQVYAFHEVAENWILRRYPPGTVEAPGAERVRGTPSESVVALFRDRSPRTTAQRDGGQDGPATCTVYTRTRLLTTEDTAGAVQPADVLFAPDGSAWQATSSGDWDEARGFAVTLTQAGRRGALAPWA